MAGYSFDTLKKPGFYNMDCMDALRQYPDKFFDLAIVDPPYGDALTNNGTPPRCGITVSGESSTNTSAKPYNRFGGRFARYKQDPPKAPATKRPWNAGADNGLQSMQTT